MKVILTTTIIIVSMQQSQPSNSSLYKMKMPYGRRNSYTVDFKILVVDWLRKNDGNVSKASREFEVDRKRVREWDQKYDTLQSHSKGHLSKRRKIDVAEVLFHLTLIFECSSFWRRRERKAESSPT